MNTEELSFYSTPGPFTDIARHRPHLSALPRDVAGLCRAVQGLVLHPHLAHLYGIAPEQLRHDDLQIRSATEALDRILELDSSDLAVPRPPERRVVGNCRHHSVLLASFLRQQGRPARARCGFGAYFQKGRFVDHWVCEVFDPTHERWARVDAQIDDLQRGAFDIRCNVLDLGSEDFLVAGEAWRRCRSGNADPRCFGILDLWGLWFVRGNVVRDLAALRKLELLPWDGWGLAGPADDTLGAEDWSALDRAAELTADPAASLAAVHALAAHSVRWRVPRTILSFGPGGDRPVDLGFEE